MFLQFFTSLRDAQVPVTLREYLTLMEALDADLADQTVENFYYLSRAALVKDERNLDKFDRVFATTFKGLDGSPDALAQAVLRSCEIKAAVVGGDTGLDDIAVLQVAGVLGLSGEECPPLDRRG